MVVISNWGCYQGRPSTFGSYGKICASCSAFDDPTGKMVKPFGQVGKANYLKTLRFIKGHLRNIQVM